MTAVSADHALPHSVTQRAVDKYQQLLSLRRSREAMEASGILSLSGEEGSARKARARQLSANFPGALKELEHCTASDFEQKLEAARKAHEEGRAPMWLAATMAFHEIVCVMLAHRQNRAIPACAIDLATEFFKRRPEWLQDTQGGRLSGWVLHGLADDLTLPVDVLHQWVFTAHGVKP